MLKLISDYSTESELGEVAGLFFDIDKEEINIECCFGERLPYITVNGNFYPLDLSDRASDNKFSRRCKAELYRVLSAYTGKTFPWGALTGVRPTKLGYEILSNGEDIVRGLKAYGVSTKKAEVIKRVIENQKGFFPSSKKINFYIHIPFCTSRCNYCSFVSLPVGGNEKLMVDYVDHLIREIESGVELLNKENYEVDSIYIGGGTPTALTDELLDKLLNAIPYDDLEYTIEAGRPDTITAEKIDIMSRHNVTRISINPQTFSDKTLKAIGRAHTASDIIKVYELSKGKFKINMDLIAGLADETISDFEYTLHRALELRPENLTVHTLARKNGSMIKFQNAVFSSGVAEMVDMAYERLTHEGYEPYYLYRQKNMLENLENIGYTLPGSICANNVTTMEEFYSVFACGAGAISKRIYEENKIERHANVRDVKLYIDQFEERLSKKNEFFM